MGTWSDRVWNTEVYSIVIGRKQNLRERKKKQGKSDTHNRKEIKKSNQALHKVIGMISPATRM